MAMIAADLEKTRESASSTSATPAKPKGPTPEQIAAAIELLKVFEGAPRSALGAHNLAYEAYIRNTEGWDDTSEIGYARDEAAALLQSLEAVKTEEIPKELLRKVGDFVRTRPFVHKYYANHRMAEWAKGKAKAEPSAKEEKPAPRKAPAPVTAYTRAAEAASHVSGANTICAAGYDDRFWQGTNGHGLLVEFLHEPLKQIVRSLRGDQLEAWGIRACAEVQAVHKALGKDADPAKLQVSSVDANGRPKPPCENCRNWLEPVGGMTNVYRIRRHVLAEARSSASGQGAASSSSSGGAEK
ncbi:MAG TPA: hypothetical protein VHJ76_05570 [Actinomycetota bacterium]|nr:hypothetical protein [Actinomycetota bacterium]